MIGRDELGHRSETVRRANLQRDRPRAARERRAVPVGSRDAHRTDAQRDPRPHRRAGRRPARDRGSRDARRHARTAIPAGATRTPTAPWSWRSRSPSTRSPRRRSGSAVRCTTSLVDLPRGHSSVVDIAAALAELAGTVRDRLASPESIVGVGVAVVGVVRRDDGWCRWRRISAGATYPLGEHLTKVLGLDVPDHLRERVRPRRARRTPPGRGARRRRRHPRWGSVGVGGGLIVDGEPLTGVAGYSGEVGHIPVNPDGLPCRCGSFGCWETEVGTGALLRRAGRPAGGRPRGVGRCLPMPRRATRSARAFAETGRWLGIGLAGLINILNPELVVLGGRLTASHPYSPLDAGSGARSTRSSGIPTHRARRRGQLGERCPLARRRRTGVRTVVQPIAAWLGPGPRLGRVGNRLRSKKGGQSRGAIDGRTITSIVIALEALRSVETDPP